MQQRLLLIVVATFWAALYVFVPVLSPYAVHLGADLGMVGLIVGSYGVTQLILRIPTGWLSDRLGLRKPFVAFGFGVTIASCLLMALAPSPGYLLLGRGLSGVSASMWVCLSVLVASYFPPEKAVVAIGLANFANNVGQVLATGSGGWLADRFGWSAPFLVSAGVAVLGLLLLIPVKEQKGSGTSGISMKALLEIISDRNLLLVAGMTGLMQYISMATVYGFTPVYAQTIGATKVHLSWLTVLTIIPGALAALRAGWVVERIGVKPTLVTAFITAVVTTAAIPYTGTLPLLFATQIVGGFGRSLAFSVMMALAIRDVTPARRAIAMGAFQSIYAIGMFVGPTIAGAVGKALGMYGLFLSTAAVGLVALVAVLAQRGKHSVAQG